MKEGIGAHSLWQLPVLGPVHADTIITTWIAMVVALLLLGWVGSSYRAPLVNKRQTVFEGIVDYIADMVYSTIGRTGEPFVPFFIALFIFLFLNNQFGIFPFKALVLPFGGSPTADLNTVVPLALDRLLAHSDHGLRQRRPEVHPAPVQAVLVPLPVERARRSVASGHVGRAPVLQHFRRRTALHHHRTDHPGAKVMIGAVQPLGHRRGPAVFIQFFNFFVGTIQAFIFTLLAIVYFSLAVAQEH